MEAKDRKMIFGLAKGLNMNDEELHALVFGLTGSEHISALTPAQVKTVTHELMERMKLGNHTEPLKTKKTEIVNVPGMMTAEQQRLAWRLMYRLQELDEKPMLHEDGKPFTVAERMCGAIKKELGITTVPGKNVFAWVGFDNGAHLIEMLKRYVRSAERRAERRTG